jgi:hypothetical protein
VCIFPDKDVLIGNKEEQDMFWFDIFDENLKEYKGKNKF